MTKINKVYEVYEQYKHLDELLCDREWLPETMLGTILYDVWQAVRDTADVDRQVREGEKGEGK